MSGRVKRAEVFSAVIQAHAPAHAKFIPPHNKPLPLRKALSNTPTNTLTGINSAVQPRVKAKAMLCLDKSTNWVVLAENECSPLPIASITKLLTAMVVIDNMDLGAVVETPSDIRQVEKHVIGIRPGDLFTVKDLLHGMLIESGNDCAETLARGYPKGDREAFIEAMNQKAQKLGLSRVKIYTPSGLDYKIVIGRKNGRGVVGQEAQYSDSRGRGVAC